jgi:succinate dehydrogenase/fumarate reductase-like Fe-S protein
MLKMKKEDEEAVVKVFRFDSNEENGPEYNIYKVPSREATLLQVLQNVYEHQDPTLAFRYGCDGSGPARCGACVMEVNETPILACQKQAEKDMVVKPHPKYKVIKDLVVDFEVEK